MCNLHIKKRGLSQSCVWTSNRYGLKRAQSKPLVSVHSIHMKHVHSVSHGVSKSFNSKWNFALSGTS